MGDLGPELFSNSTFNTDLTGWQLNGSATIAWAAPGTAEVTINGVSGGIAESQTLALQVGAIYRLAFVCRSGTYVGNFLVVVNSVSVFGGAYPADYTTFIVPFIATVANPSIIFSRNSAATGTVYFDSISLRRQ